MVFRVPRFEKIKDFCSFQKQLQSLSTKQQLGKIQFQKTAETSDNEPNSTELSRSIKKELKCPELTFERQFIKQHLESYDYKMQSYLEQMFSMGALGRKPSLRSDIFPKKMIAINQENNLVPYLDSVDCLLSQKSKQMLMEYLGHEQKLGQFLSYVCANSCDQVSHEMIFISNEILQKYIQISHLQYPYQKLLLQSKNFTESLCHIVKNHPQINYITLENTLIKPSVEVQRRDQEIQKLIEFLTITIFLILSHQFTNPYYQQKVQSEFKRHTFFNNYSNGESFQGFSQEEDEEDINFLLMGRKKLK